MTRSPNKEHHRSGESFKINPNSLSSLGRDSMTHISLYRTRPRRKLVVSTCLKINLRRICAPLNPDPLIYGLRFSLSPYFAKKDVIGPNKSQQPGPPPPPTAANHHRQRQPVKSASAYHTPTEDDPICGEEERTAKKSLGFAYEVA